MAKHLKLPKINFFSLAIIALLLFIPLYPKFPLFNVPGTYVAIRAEDLMVALIVGLWGIWQAWHRFPFLKQRVNRLIVLYWVVGGISLLSAFFITKNIVPHVAVLHWLRRIEYMSLFLIALSSVSEVRNVRSYGFTLLIATAGVIAYGVGQKFLGWPVVSTMNEEFSKGLLLQLTEWTRVNSTFAGHYDLAAYAVIFLAISAAFIISLKEKWLKLLFLLAALLTFYLLILTASRISFVAYIAAIVFVLVFSRKQWWVIPVVLTSIVFMSFSTEFNQRFSALFRVDLSFLSGIVRVFQKSEVVREIAIAPTPAPGQIVVSGGAGAKGGPAGTPTPEPTIIYRVASESAWPVEPAELAAERSGAIRFNVEWPRSIRAFEKNPFLGTGYSSVTLATDNDYLRLLAETGLLGFLSFGLIFLEIMRKFLVFLQENRSRFEKIIAVGIVGAVVGILLNAAFIDVFESSKVAYIFWILLGTLVGMTNLKESKFLPAKK